MMGKNLAAFVIYASLIYASEITFGSAYFPWHLWSFNAVPAVFWSVPIHLGGWAWILYVVRNDSGAPVWQSALRSTFYFAFGEVLNLFIFHIFPYRMMGGSVVPPFLCVIGLYVILSWITVKLVRA